MVYSPHCAPSILITFINMVLFKDTKFDPVCETPTMYAGQLGLQKLLVFVALLCVPWMLLAKPIIIMRNQRKLNYSVSIMNIIDTKLGLLLLKKFDNCYINWWALPILVHRCPPKNCSNRSKSFVEIQAVSECFAGFKLQ